MNQQLANTMDDQHLLEQEEVITRSDGNIITLTNLRLRYTEKPSDQSRITSILLEKISSIDVSYRSKPIYIGLGLLAVITGVALGYEGEDGFQESGVVLGAIFIIIYFTSRKHYLNIASDGGSSIHFQTKGMKRETILKFINQVEGAIRSRREALSRN